MTKRRVGDQVFISIPPDEIPEWLRYPAIRMEVLELLTRTEPDRHCTAIELHERNGISLQLVVDLKFLEGEK